MPITAKLVANLITRAGANRVLTMDLHAAQIQGFFDVPVDHLYAAPVLNEHFLQLRTSTWTNVVIVSPDEGSIKRALGHAKRIGGTRGHHRQAPHRAPKRPCRRTSWAARSKGKVALMFDDMISTAGSITGAAKVLHEHGVKEIHVAATHAVLCGPAIERLKAANLASLVVTDSIPLRDDQILPQTQVLTRRPAAGRSDQADSPQRVGQPAVSIAVAVTPTTTCGLNGPHPSTAIGLSKLFRPR